MVNRIATSAARTTIAMTILPYPGTGIPGSAQAPQEQSEKCEQGVIPDSVLDRPGTEQDRNEQRDDSGDTYHDTPFRFGSRTCPRCSGSSHRGHRLIPCSGSPWGQRDKPPASLSGSPAPCTTAGYWQTGRDCRARWSSPLLRRLGALK